MPLSVLRERSRPRAEQIIARNPAQYPDRRRREELLDNIALRSEMVYGPREMTVTEQRRAELGPAGRAVPTDVCVWGQGEPRNPAGTKIGGRPFRPPGLKWPMGPLGEPMGLLAQFCFTDSIDVVPARLPGDLMLLFTNGPSFASDWEPEDETTWAIEWHSLSSHLELAASPPRVLDVTPTWAELHRTMDYPDWPTEDDPSIISGSKFGGIPRFQQGDPGLPGVHVCTLGSLNPFGNPWPLLNVPKNPHGDEQYFGGNLLMIGDLGAAYFFVDEHGATRWSADCG